MRRPEIEVGLQSVEPEAGRGVWVLRLPRNESAAARQRCLVGLALSMEERCRTIQDLGGQFFANEDVWLAVLSAEEVAEAEQLDLSLARLDKEVYGAEVED